MKLLTTIKPRSDGTVIVRDAKGAPLVFKRDDSGDLVCDIDDAALVGRLLKLSTFEPADESDHAQAEALLLAAGGGEGDGEDDDAEGDDDDPVDPNAMPVEANTRPVPKAKPRRR